MIKNTFKIHEIKLNKIKQTKKILKNDKDCVGRELLTNNNGQKPKKKPNSGKSRGFLCSSLDHHRFNRPNMYRSVHLPCPNTYNSHLLFSVFSCYFCCCVAFSLPKSQINIHSFSHLSKLFFFNRITKFRTLSIKGNKQ